MAASHKMTLDLYDAAVTGNHEKYYDVLRPAKAADNGVGCIEVTASGNTVLHVAVLHGRKQFVEKILEKDEDHVASSMLLTSNNKGESALHCAAEKGHANIVSILLSAAEKCRQDVEHGCVGVRAMIEMRDNVKDTALHKAVRMRHLEVVKLLVKEDPEFEYPANDAGETPIYIAAELQLHCCLNEMLNTCTKPTYDGPLGRNALHGAVLSGFGYTKCCSYGVFFGYTKCCSHKEFATECTKLLLENNIGLCEETDDFGWTPLHYAAKINNDKVVDMILEEKTSAAYIHAGDKAKWTTTFHIAAMKGNIEMMKLISQKCPDCWEMVNSKGQNVLHEVIVSKNLNVIRHIEESSGDQFENLVNHKDEDGNTPLHLLAVTDCKIMSKFMKKHPMLDYFAFNKEHQTLFDKAISCRAAGYNRITKGRRRLLNRSKTNLAARLIENPKEEEDKKLIEDKIERGKTSIIVATLIITMTFAAGITVPGGYNQEGYPILLGNAAFKAFIITNTLSFLSSICSIVVHIAMLKIASLPGCSYEIVHRLYVWQDRLLRLTFLGVIIAFLCGMYATLAPKRSFAIIDLVLGIGIALLPLKVYRKAYKILYY